MKIYAKIHFMTSLILLISGITMILIPNKVFELILNISIIYLFIHAFTMIIKIIKDNDNSYLLAVALSLVFGIFLTRFPSIPEWIIRVVFGAYCILMGTACFIQSTIDHKIHDKFHLFHLFLAFIYIALGFILLFCPDFPTTMLMQAFGIYFVILSLEYFYDGFVNINPKIKNEWKRKFRVTLPVILCALIPDWALNWINHHLNDNSKQKIIVDKDASCRLRIIIQMGKDGFKKIGHICFSYDDMIYSYGNYDSSSFRFNQTLGDGTYFMVPISHYIKNMIDVEDNYVFEYGIYTTQEQNERIEAQIKDFVERSSRWYTLIEKHKSDHDRYIKNDYPSRLHYHTGAKFYKINEGKFSKYWALGDNCALFTDLILGVLGADVLSMKGIVSPGTYLNWMENEYLKKDTPIIYRYIHI